MPDLEQRPLIVWVKNNAAVLSFLKASDKVFCSFVVSRGSLRGEFMDYGTF